MAWYVKYSDDGSVIEKRQTGRGRPPAGFERVEDDPAPHLAPKVSSKVINSPAKSKSAQEKIVYIYVKRGPDGEILDTMNPRRGRMPAGYEKVTKAAYLAQIGSDKIREDIPQVEVQEAPEVSEASGEQDIQQDVSTEIKTGPMKELSGGFMTQHFTAQKKMSLEAFQNSLSFTVIERASAEDIISMQGCHVIDRLGLSVDCMHLSDTVSRIDVVSSSGDIRIWKNNPLGNPDVILEGAIAG